MGPGTGYGPLVPVEFLTDERAEAYGKFAEEPTRPDLERFFFLDDVDRDLIALRRSTHHQLGFALRMCTVRYIGRFLPDDPLDAPWPVVEHLAAQLGIEDPSVVKRYTERPKTAYEHAWEIRDAYEYQDGPDGGAGPVRAGVEGAAAGAGGGAQAHGDAHCGDAAPGGEGDRRGPGPVPGPDGHPAAERGEAEDGEGAAVHAAAVGEGVAHARAGGEGAVRGTGAGRGAGGGPGRGRAVGGAGGSRPARRRDDRGGHGGLAGARGRGIGRDRHAGRARDPVRHGPSVPVAAG
ncbi:DUF4158 domain-containing protein [Streptosporangium vulgare]|uniref:DUF4158 domain-containing protein n=1 Tax=Streptosporangium vulgare TaxID=46190 RepID=A0ABV5TRK2_9ACTN